MVSEGLLGSGRCPEDRTGHHTGALQGLCRPRSCQHSSVSRVLTQYQVLCASYFIFVITLEIGYQFYRWGN